MNDDLSYDVKAAIQRAVLFHPLFEGTAAEALEIAIAAIKAGDEIRNCPECASSPAPAEKMELAEAGLRHADGLTAQLDRPHWVPSRAHIEQARNSIKKLAEMILASSPAQEPVTMEPVAWRWRTLPKFSQGAEDQQWVVTPRQPNFINSHHHEVEPLYALPAPPQPGRDAVIEECAKIAESSCVTRDGVKLGVGIATKIRALTGEPK